MLLFICVCIWVGEFACFCLASHSGGLLCLFHVSAVEEHVGSLLHHFLLAHHLHKLVVAADPGSRGALDVAVVVPRVQGVARVDQHTVKGVHDGLSVLPTDVARHVQPGREGNHVLNLHPVLVPKSKPLELDCKHVGRVADEHLLDCPDHLLAPWAAILVAAVQDLLASEHVECLFQRPGPEYFQVQVQDGIKLVRLVVAGGAVDLAPELAPLLRDGDPLVLDAVAATMVSMGKDTEPILQEARKNARGHAKVVITHALGQLSRS